MAVFPNSYVKIGLHTNARINYIVDNLLTPRLLAFRQVTIYDEPAVLMPDNITWKTTYNNWNEAFPLVVHKNKAKIPSAQVTNVNYSMGTYECGTNVTGDNSNITYNIDYFGIGILAGLIYQAIDTINTAAFGSATEYTIDTAPQYWDGVIADVAFALCMEKLLLDYDLWHGRLIFAIGAQALEDGGGDVVGTIETLKQNSEERAYKSMENERFKIRPTLAKPTAYYYQSIRGGVGRSGAHNIASYGHLRGFRNNKYS